MVLLITLCSVLCTASGGGSSLRIDGRSVRLTPHLRMIDGAAYVPLGAFAELLGMEAKTIVADKLVVLCTDATCHPMHLLPSDIVHDSDVMFVRLAKAAGVTGFEVSRSDGVFSLTSVELNRDANLEIGSVLPDVVLTDTEGKRVHTSDFIGRRVVFCTWASW